MNRLEHYMETYEHLGVETTTGDIEWGFYLTEIGMEAIEYSNDKMLAPDVQEVAEEFSVSPLSEEFEL